jgi:hypothetical protein
MDIEKLSKISQDKEALFLFSPSYLDFTGKGGVVFYVIGKSDYVEIKVDKKNAFTVFSYLKQSVFKPEKLVFCWGVKSFFSYVLAVSGKAFSTEAIILDLKVLESFLDCKGQVPKGVAECKTRIRFMMGNKSWHNLQEIYKKIHLPLINKTLPGIETVGLINKELRREVFPAYQIEGQLNGRLLCSKVLEDSFNPHTLSKEDKLNLCSRQPNDLFLHFDYRHMEVSVLQWLSGDAVLGDMINSGEDLYSSIFKKIFGVDCETSKQRKLCKSFFLPVVYGLSKNALSEKLGVSISMADHIYNGICRHFKTAISWVEQRQTCIADVSIDYFGRNRIFKEKKYRARNFAIQAPASLVCLDKLIKLYDLLESSDAEVVFHVHDAFVILARPLGVTSLCKDIKILLEENCEMYDGLKLKTECRVGNRLVELKHLKI